MHNSVSAFAFSKFLLIFVVIDQVRGNGRLLEPPSRSSLWRSAEFKYLDPPINYNDNHLDCGGALVPEDEHNYCGICGDPITETPPRSNEDNGTFARGIIVRTYKCRQEIPITVQLTYGQKGFFDISLCASDKSIDHVDHNCYQHNILLENYPITDSEGKYYNFNVTLPSVKCSNCVLRWRYRTGNNWGECGFGKPGALGCGPQQSFHGCSDIAIY